MRRAILGSSLTQLGADQLGHLELHHLPSHGLDRLRITSACSSSNTFLTTSSIVILSAPATRRPLSSSREKPDDLQRRVGGTTFRPTRTYTTLRDVTRSR